VEQSNQTLTAPFLIYTTALTAKISGLGSHLCKHHLRLEPWMDTIE